MSPGGRQFPPEALGLPERWRNDYRRTWPRRIAFRRVIKRGGKPGSTRRRLPPSETSAPAPGRADWTHRFKRETAEPLNKAEGRLALQAQVLPSSFERAHFPAVSALSVGS
jgi:hypothetical protein